MKCINLIYKNADDLIKVKHDLKDYLPENILIQVFYGISDIDTANILRSLLCKEFPGSALIGASSAGELLNANILEKSIVISFAAFKNTKARSALIDQNDDLTAGGKELGSILDNNEIKAAIVLGCGLKAGNYVNAFPFMKALNCALGNTIIAGGLSGGYHEQESRVFVFTEHHLTEHGFVAATLCGPDLCVNTAHNLSWMPIGKKMTITHVKGRRIYSIDGKSVKEVYRQYLGIEALPSSISVINHFPLMVQRRGMQVTNPVLSVNTDGSFSVLEKLEVGEQVRFSYCDAGFQEKGARRMGKHLAEYQPEAFFIYSCEFRKNLFEDDILADMAAVQKGPTSAGFFTFGECYTDSDKVLHFLQQTMTVLSLSESDSCEPIHKENISTEKFKQPSAELRRSRLLKVMSHLVSSTTRELALKNKQLEKLVNRDGLTRLFNRRFFDDTLLHRIKEHGRSGTPLSLILLDVDYFKKFNDFYGHVAGDMCLRRISDLLKRLMRRDSDMAFRYGGEEFSCILPATTHAGAMQKAKSIRSSVEDLVIPHKPSEISEVVTVSLGVITLTGNRNISPQELTDACDQLLYEAKNKGKNRVQGKNLT